MGSPSALDGLVGKGLHLAQQALLARGDQRNGDAGLAGAAGAPDAVDVQFGIIRQVIVEDVRDVVDIQAARGHIGGHQHFDLGIAEAVEGAFTGILVQVAVQGFGGETARAQCSGQFPGGERVRTKIRALVISSISKMRVRAASLSRPLTM